jgi:hypothetical protein
MMDRRRQNRRGERRRSVAYFPSSAESRHLEGDAFLLARDIPLGIFPFRSSQNKDFSIEFRGASEREIEALPHLLDFGQYRSASVEEAIRDYVDEVSNRIAYFGEAYYEILPRSGEEPETVAALPPGRILRLPRRRIQVIPRADREVVGRKVVVLDSDRIWRIALPRELGTPRRHRRLLRELQASAAHTPAFAFEGLDLGRGRGYEFAAQRAASERVQERLTGRHWGSGQSQQRPPGKSNEFFYISRRLAFHRAQAQLREHLFEEANDLLVRLGWQGTIVVEGLPTTASMTTVASQLKAGEISFPEALEAWRI